MENKILENSSKSPHFHLVEIFWKYLCINRNIIKYMQKYTGFHGTVFQNLVTNIFSVYIILLIGAKPHKEMRWVFKYLQVSTIQRGASGRAVRPQWTPQNSNYTFKIHKSKFPRTLQKAIHESTKIKLYIFPPIPRVVLFTVQVLHEFTRYTQ